MKVNQVVLYLEALKQQTLKRVYDYDNVLKNSKSDLSKVEYESRIDELKKVISEIEMKIDFLKFSYRK